MRPWLAPTIMLVCVGVVSWVAFVALDAERINNCMGGCLPAPKLSDETDAWLAKRAHCHELCAVRP